MPEVGAEGLQSSEGPRVAGLGATVTAIDLAAAAIAAAAAATPPTLTIDYRVADLFELGRTPARYDLIAEHTCFCAIDPGLRDAYVEAVFEALKPGGSLLGVFYMNPYDSDHQPGDGPPHGATHEELVARFTGSGRFTIESSYVPSHSYSGREGLEMNLRMIRN